MLPLVTAAQRQSILLTDAYLARALDRPPLGVDATAVIASLRRDTTPDQVYRRPFVTVWTALSKGTPFEQAIAAGLVRAAATAAMDVQLAHRGALQAAQDLDPRIRGYRRVADASACTYCSALDGAFVKNADAMALHNGCGCGLEPVDEEPDTSPLPDGVAVRRARRARADARRPDPRLHLTERPVGTKPADARRVGHIERSSRDG